MTLVKTSDTQNKQIHKGDFIDFQKIKDKKCQKLSENNRDGKRTIYKIKQGLGEDGKLGERKEEQQAEQKLFRAGKGSFNSER